MTTAAPAPPAPNPDAANEECGTQEATVGHGVTPGAACMRSRSGCNGANNVRAYTALPSGEAGEWWTPSSLGTRGTKSQ